MIKEIAKKFIKTHWVSLLCIAALALCLKIKLNYFFILSFLVLFLAYFVLGILVEFIMEKITLARGTKYTAATESADDGQVPEIPVSGEPAPTETTDDTEEIQSPLQRPVLQKKNTPRFVPSGGLEKLQPTRAQFVDLSPDEDKTPSLESSVASSDFLIRTHRMYQTNQARNKGAAVESAETADETEEVVVTPIVTNTDTTKESVPQPKQETILPETFEFVEDVASSSELDQVSDDLTKEIDKRIEESARTLPRRRKDYSVEESTETRPVRPAQIIRPAIFQRESEVESAPIPEPVHEPAYTDDKVHADRTMVNALFEMSHQQTRPAAAPSHVRKASVPATSIPAPAEYDIPSLDHLRTGRKKEQVRETDGEQDPRAKRLIDTLASFGVGAKVTAVIKGPAVTRYEIQPNPGVKVSRIVSLADDISLNLAATGVRIEAPIPGKEAVGIEVPNQEVEIVYLKDVIDSPEYQASRSNLTFAIGKDIAGTNIIHDIAKMPHLLIAGATGAGKSVCINTIIASILYKSGPEQVRMIMIDPKIVELGVYNGIPHLLVPVVTNPKKAAAALAWAVGEMERRYGEFSQFGVRDIKGYNELASRRKTMTNMPQIVIIIDELADLMMVAAKEIEDSIIRLAQKARAAGLHLIIATQRPSVDVITGLIKANIPSRIAFAVSSQVDSRTILDGIGAEKLLGRGDMLFHPIGMSKPMRVQGAFVSDGEIEALVADIKRNCGTVVYSEEIQASMEAKASGNTGSGGTTGTSGGDEEDCDTEVIQAAAELALEYKQLSTSFLQRKLKLGYSRASRVVDALESAGLISSADGSKPRQLLMTREEWEATQK